MTPTSCFDRRSFQTFRPIGRAPLRVISTLPSCLTRRQWALDEQRISGSALWPSPGTPIYVDEPPRRDESIRPSPHTPLPSQCAGLDRPHPSRGGLPASPEAEDLGLNHISRLKTGCSLSERRQPAAAGLLELARGLQPRATRAPCRIWRVGCVGLLLQKSASTGTDSHPAVRVKRSIAWVSSASIASCPSGPS